MPRGRCLAQPLEVVESTLAKTLDLQISNVQHMFLRLEITLQSFLLAVAAVQKLTCLKVCLKFSPEKSIGTAALSYVVLKPLGSRHAFLKQLLHAVRSCNRCYVQDCLYMCVQG